MHFVFVLQTLDFIYFFVPSFLYLGRYVICNVGVLYRSATWEFSTIMINGTLKQVCYQRLCLFVVVAVALQNEKSPVDCGISD